MKKKKRYLGLLIPSIILEVLGLVGIGFGSAFIGSTYSQQSAESLAEALGMAFAIVIIVAIGAVCLAIGIVCILIGTPLLFGGIALKKKDDRQVK